MARTTLPPQPDEAPTQPESQAQAQAQAQPSSSSSRLMPVITLVLRLITLASLTLSTSLFASNSTTITAYGTQTTVHFNDIYAYRYALSTAVIGLAYTLFQLPFSVYQARSGKMLVNQASFLVYDFLGDKVVLALLGTGVGAAFGATVDLKSKMDELEDALVQYFAITTFSPIISKLDDFFSRAYLPAIFLLIAFLTCGASSVLSSLALINNTTQ